MTAAVVVTDDDDVATENQSDGKQHLSAIPVGQWRYFVARLQSVVPNKADRCVGASYAASTAGQCDAI